MPNDPRHIPFEPSLFSFVATAIVGLMLVFFVYRQKNRSYFLLCLGCSILLTTPLLFNVHEAVWGAYPTIDKEGSLLFYNDGVHFRVFESEGFFDPAHRLIGFHMGHLWVSQLFDIFVEDFAAFNMQALLNIVLSWFCTYLFLKELGGKKSFCWLIASMFALHAHVFRDINWYTIEKSSLYCLPLFWWALHRCSSGWKQSVWVLPLTFLLSSWINLYWGILCALLCALLLPFYMYKNPRNRNILAVAVSLCIVCGIGIALYQLRLMHSGPSFGTPDAFLERAALDHFSLWPLSWNRLSWHASIPPVLVALLGWGLYKKQLQFFYLVPTCFFLLLSLGPWLVSEQIPNPLYHLLAALPGFWRFAKPEAFFFLSFLSLLCTIHRLRPSPKELRYLTLALLMQWGLGVRNSQEYPQFSQFIPAQLPKNWEKRVFQN